MSSTPSKTNTTTTVPPLGGWVDQVIKNIFFVSDDNIVTNTFRDDVSPDFTARINLYQFTYEQFVGTVQAARGQERFTLLSNDEILCWEEPDGSGAGSVTHVTRFTSTNKQTGKTTVTKSVTLATVGVKDGKRVLLALAETSKPEEE